jgi:hypothetical protein
MANRELLRRRTRKWNDKNRGVMNEANAWYRARKLGRVPVWALDERPAIRALFKKADEDSTDLSPLEVDHDVQMAGLPDVCGLHCLANLRIVRRDLNRAVWSISEQEWIKRR